MRNNMCPTFNTDFDDYLEILHGRVYSAHRACCWGGSTTLVLFLILIEAKASIKCATEMNALNAAALQKIEEAKTSLTQ